MWISLHQAATHPHWIDISNSMHVWLCGLARVQTFKRFVSQIEYFWNHTWRKTNYFKWQNLKQLKFNDKIYQTPFRMYWVVWAITHGNTRFCWNKNRSIGFHCDNLLRFQFSQIYCAFENLFIHWIFHHNFNFLLV